MSEICIELAEASLANKGNHNEHYKNRRNPSQARINRSPARLSHLDHAHDQILTRMRVRHAVSIASGPDQIHHDRSLGQSRIPPSIGQKHSARNVDADQTVAGVRAEWRIL